MVPPGSVRPGSPYGSEALGNPRLNPLLGVIRFPQLGYAGNVARSQGQITMVAILTTTIAVAAIVLGAAAVAKLRSPGGAERALAAVGLSMPRAVVRVIASAELALAALVLLAPGRVTSGLLAVMYAVLAVVAHVLAGRGAACGCFGAERAPASAAHVWLSAVLAATAAAGVAWPPSGLAWLLSGSPGVAAPLALGIAGAAYATVIVYTELPSAWSAWRPR